MGGAVLAQGDAGVRGGDFYVGEAVGHLLAELVIDAAGDEFGEAADEGDLAGDGKAGGGANHVGFGDAALDEALREFRRKGVHLEGALEVCRECNYAGIPFARFQKSRTEPAAGVFFTCICVFHN